MVSVAPTGSVTGKGAGCDAGTVSMTLCTSKDTVHLMISVLMHFMTCNLLMFLTRGQTMVLHSEHVATHGRLNGKPHIPQSSSCMSIKFSPKLYYLLSWSNAHM